MSEKNKPNGVVGPLVSRPVDEERNRLILADVERVLNEGRSPLALTQRKDHVELLVTQARALTPHVIALQGGRTPRQRVALAEQMAAIPEGAKSVLVGTGPFVGEGFDDPRLDTLLLAMPCSWKGTQSSTRVVSSGHSRARSRSR